MTPIAHYSNNGSLAAPPNWESEIEVETLKITSVVVDGMPALISFWRPDEQELEAIKNGANVMLWVYGNAHPVVSVGVEPAEMALRPDELND